MMMSETSAIRPKILVVDDTPANLVAMRRLLARMDCEVVEVGDGNAALSACLDHEFALILLDVQMPEMDGFEVATLLAESSECHSAPIIFVTAAYKDDLNRLNGYEVGAVDYRSEEHTSELQSLMRISYAVFCLNKNKK